MPGKKLSEEHGLPSLSLVFGYIAIKESAFWKIVFASLPGSGTEMLRSPQSVAQHRLRLVRLNLQQKRNQAKDTKGGKNEGG